MSVWENIINDISNSHVDIIYMAIGCGMKSYTEISPSKNQQNPGFLDKFKRKLYILIDPDLESPLKMEKQISGLETTTLDTYRILKNDSIIIHAINEYFHYDLSIKYNLENNYIETNTNYTIILNIVSIILERKIKFIFQDYTGNDTTNVYCELMNIFDSNELLKYVNFDVTQQDSGCYINISPDMISYDINDNFIQEKFSLLSNIKTSNKLKDIVNFRINILNYELLWSYNKSLETNSFYIVNQNKIKFLCMIYNIDTRFLDYNTDLLYALDKIKELMISIIKDLVHALDYEPEMTKFLIDNICNKSDFVNITCMMKKIE